MRKTKRRLFILGKTTLVNKKSKTTKLTFPLLPGCFFLDIQNNKEIIRYKYQYDLKQKIVRIHFKRIYKNLISIKPRRLNNNVFNYVFLVKKFDILLWIHKRGQNSKHQNDIYAPTVLQNVLNYTTFKIILYRF